MLISSICALYIMLKLSVTRKGKIKKKKLCLLQVLLTLNDIMLLRHILLCANSNRIDSPFYFIQYFVQLLSEASSKPVFTVHHRCYGNLVISNLKSNMFGHTANVSLLYRYQRISLYLLHQRCCFWSHDQDSKVNFTS